MHVGLVGAVRVGQGAQAQEVSIVQEGGARCLTAITSRPANLQSWHHHLVISTHVTLKIGNTPQGVRWLQTPEHD